MEYCLCGGTFFTLLTAAKRPNSKRKTRYLGQECATSEKMMFTGLMQLMNPQYKPYNPQSLGVTVSEFKNCRKSSGTDLPLHDSAFTFDFHKRVLSVPHTVYLQMYEYCQNFLLLEDPVKMTWLARALLELLLFDPSIPDEAEFPLCPDQKPVRKSALNREEQLDLSVFLVGILDYIVIHVPDNTSGRKMLEGLNLPKENKYQTTLPDMHIGDRVSAKIRVCCSRPEFCETTESVAEKGAICSEDAAFTASNCCTEWIYDADDPDPMREWYAHIQNPVLSFENLTELTQKFCAILCCFGNFRLRFYEIISLIQMTLEKNSSDQREVSVLTYLSDLKRMNGSLFTACGDWWMFFPDPVCRLCARYCLTQSDQFFSRVGMFLLKQSLPENKRILSILYDMDPDRVDACVIFPALQQEFEKGGIHTDSDMTEYYRDLKKKAEKRRTISELFRTEKER